MDALGTRLHTVQVLIDAARVEAEKQKGHRASKEMEESFRKGTQLVEIIIVSDAVQESTVDDEWIGAMFAHPLKQLQKLHMQGPRCMYETMLPMIGDRASEKLSG